MKRKVNVFVDLYDKFHDFDKTDQIVLLAYFHTVEEEHETVSRKELEVLFRFANLRIPKSLPQLLTYLCGKGNKLVQVGREYSLQRKALTSIRNEVQRLRGQVPPLKIQGVDPFSFSDRTFKDKKVEKLLEECRRCYAQHCWNACGILTRIILERTLDSVDPRIKSKAGLRDKLNFCKDASDLFSKSVREGLRILHGAKIVGDIAAHHTTILLEENDIGLALSPFRMLVKEVKTI